jgi:hypothetical protein
MDPLGTWEMVGDSLAEGQDGWDDAIDALGYLLAWLNKGGFQPPEVPGKVVLHGLLTGLETIRRQRNLNVNPDL